MPLGLIVVCCSQLHAAIGAWSPGLTMQGLQDEAPNVKVAHEAQGTQRVPSHGSGPTPDATPAEDLRGSHLWTPLTGSSRPRQRRLGKIQSPLPLRQSSI